jgi:hypothetical protein
MTLHNALREHVRRTAADVCTPGCFVTESLNWLDESGAMWYTAVPTMHQAILSRAASAGNGGRSSTLRFARSSDAERHGTGR